MGSCIRTVVTAYIIKKMTDLSQVNTTELGNIARLFYTNETDLVTVNFYWILFLTILAVMLLWPLINGLPRILGEMNNLYMAPPPTGYGVGISGIGSRVAYVPQMQDYEYGDLGYDPTDLMPDKIPQVQRREDRPQYFDGFREQDISP